LRELPSGRGPSEANRRKTSAHPPRRSRDRRLWCTRVTLWGLTRRLIPRGCQTRSANANCENDQNAMLHSHWAPLVNQPTHGQHRESHHGCGRKFHSDKCCHSWPDRCHGRSVRGLP
jgi:hypothetical protein